MPCTEETTLRVVALSGHVKNHEWEPLKNFTEFIGDQDDAVVYAIIRPHAGGKVVLIRYLQETITAEEVQRIKNLVSEDAWEKL
jgi:hypothetical protein